MKLGMGVGLGPGHTVLDGDPAPPKGAQQQPSFSTHVYCGKTVVHFNYCSALVTKNYCLCIEFEVPTLTRFNFKDGNEYQDIEKGW